MQADFSYGPTVDGAGCQLAVTILADRAVFRDEMRDDALEAGFRLRNCSSLVEYADGEIASLGDLVLVDCGRADAAAMATLSRLDARVGQSGAQLVVSTTLDALDTVFGCVSHSGAQILVDPSRAERIVALGRVLAQVPSLRVRELAEDDRLMLLRLAEQVGSIAQRLERLGPSAGGAGSARADGPLANWGGQEQTAPTPIAPPLPDAASIRTIIRQRQARAKFFDNQLFADPAWDILLDLAAARAERRQVSVTSLCIAAAVPATTALRWIAQLVDAGLLLRVADPADRRRVNIALSDHATDQMARYFSEIGIRSQKPLREVG